MVNIDKQISYWRESAEEDWLVAGDLLEKKRIRHALFFGHLTLEKILKAHVCRVTEELAPPIHNLVRLAERAAIELTNKQRDLLAEVNEFNIEGRYPDSRLAPPNPEVATQYLQQIAEMRECLNTLFKKP